MVYLMGKRSIGRVAGLLKDKARKKETKINALRNGKGKDTHPAESKNWNSFYWGGYDRGQEILHTACLCKECARGEIKIPRTIEIVHIELEYRYLKEYIDGKKKEKKGKERRPDIPVRDKQPGEGGGEVVGAPKPLGMEAIGFRLQVRPEDGLRYLPGDPAF